MIENSNLKIYIVVIFSVLISAFIFILPPRFIISEEFITIEKGESNFEIANDLYQNRVIQSPFLFRAIFKILGDNSAKSGTYYLGKGENLFTLIYRIKTADYQVKPIKVVLPEGVNVFEIAEIMSNKLPNFDKDEFLALVEPKEGFLFPDTYLISPEATEIEVADLLEATFEEKTKDLFEEFNINDYEEMYDIVNLASIVEEETYNNDDRRIVAGILQNRLKINMALQVDVTFQYINGKNSYNLTLDDLKIDSPYNTYTNTGLPPTPISSPGLDSIRAVLDPVKTDYLYFLSSRNGVMYYAKTFEGHKVNRQKYL